MMTSFTRIIIVLSILRHALGLQQTPPNQVLVGLSLFLSLFVMAPVISDVNRVAITPYGEEQIDIGEAVSRSGAALHGFMSKQPRKTDLMMFARLDRKSVGTGQCASGRVHRGDHRIMKKHKNNQ